jgi:hypothetical protein
MKTGNEQYIIDAISSMSISEARNAIASGKFGSVGSPNHSFASNFLASKEADDRDARETESLSISRKALELSERANSISLKTKSVARRANIIAIIAIVLSTTTTIIAIIITLLLTFRSLKKYF